MNLSREQLREFFWRRRLPALFLVYFSAAVLVVRMLHLDTLGSYLIDHLQFADLQLLKESPFESLLYLNSQPPLLNFIVWVLQCLPGSLYGNFVLVNAACIAGVSLFVFLISRRYVSRGVAFLVGFVFLVTPAALLNIGYPFYPCLTALGYSMLLYAFFLKPNRIKASLGYFIFAVAYLSMLRSSFSPLHGLFFFALYWLVFRQSLRLGAVLALFSAVVFSIALIPAKNFYLYDFFAASAWGPVNIAKGVGLDLPLGYFPNPEHIRKYYPELRCAHAYGPQDSADFKNVDQGNYNSCYYVEYAKMAKAVVAEDYDIELHMRRVALHALMYVSPPDKYFLLRNRAPITGYADFVNRYVFGTVVIPRNHSVRLTLFLISGIALWAFIRKRDGFVGICLLFLAVHFISHVLTDGDEGDRFVFDVEFIFFALVPICLGYLYGSIRTWSARRPVSNAM